MKKKVLTIILAIFLCLGTVGCGEKDVPENVFHKEFRL